MVLFIGDKPSSRMKSGAKPFEGAACELRLNSWIVHLRVRHYKVINSVDDGAPTWCLWAIEDGYPIVALGSNASKFLGSLPHFKLPHPSGRNRQINDTGFIMKRLEACKTYIKENS